ncbi:hypothetical protein Dimus_032382 [Dionaea muscipula]
MDGGRSSDGGGVKLHIAMLPWLAMGHLIPYLHLSKRLTQKGHRVSFFTTPKNATAVANLLHPPASISSAAAIDVISIPLLHNPDHELPPEAECTMDIETAKQPLLKLEFDSLSESIAAVLRSAKPDWVIHDFTSPWIHPIAAEIGVPCVYFSVHTASTMSFVGPPDAILGHGDGFRRRVAPEDFAVVPSWVPFDSTIVYRLHELKKLGIAKRGESNDFQRFGDSILGSDLVAIRTCSEFEPEWIYLLSELYKKPVIPIGPLFPATGEAVNTVEGGGGGWSGGPIKEWLDKQRLDSVLYVALGTEAVLTRDELAELANGLEKSRLPFI